ncbi:MAG: STAS domain-containing protein [Piscinibacter sp.]
MSIALTLPAELSIYTAGETRSAWLTWLAEHGDGPLAVDAASVAEVDAAGVQLIVALSRSLAAQQRELCLINPSPALHSACERLGLLALLNAGARA